MFINIPASNLLIIYGEKEDLSLIVLLMSRNNEEKYAWPIFLHPNPPPPGEKMSPILLFLCTHSSYSASKFPLNCLAFFALSFADPETRRIIKEYKKLIMYGLQKLFALRPLLSQMFRIHQRLCTVL